MTTYFIYFDCYTILLIFAHIFVPVSMKLDNPSALHAITTDETCNVCIDDMYILMINTCIKVLVLNLDQKWLSH